MSFTAEQAAKIRQRAVDDPYFFLPRLLHLELDWYHRAALRLELEHPLSMLEMWRGGGKSIVRTTGRGIWEICRNPNTRGLILSETEDQASAFVRGIRGILETNELLKALFGKFVGVGKWTDTKIVVAQRTANWDEPTITAMGIGGPMTGRHYDWIILDDIFDLDSARSPTLRELTMETIRSKIDPCLLPGGWVAGNCTRYHYKDPAGHIEREFAVNPATGENFVYRIEHPDDAPAIMASIPRNSFWKVLQIPAIRRDGEATCPARFPLEDRVEPDGKIIRGLNSRRRLPGGERPFCEQYLMVCREVKKGETETEFKRAWFRGWSAPPDRARLDVFQVVDPAFRDREQAAMRTKRDRDPDYYAIGVVGFDRAAGRCYVLDAFRDRCTPLERETRAKEFADRHKPRLIEVERTGLQVVEAPEFYTKILKALQPHRARFGRPSGKGDKVARAQPFARALEAGEVEWNPEVFEAYHGLVDEFVEFPFALHDDLVDAIAGAYLLGSRRRPQSLAAFQEQGRPGGVGGGDRATAEASPAIQRRTVAAVPAAERSSRSVDERGGGSMYGDSRAVPWR